MAACLYIGVMLIFVGLIYIFLRRGQNQDSETDIEIKDFKLKGGPGPVLIVLGVLLVVFESLFQPIPPVDEQSNEYRLSVTPSVVTPSITPSVDTPSAEINNVWIEYNVWEDSYGMRVHVNFDTYNLKDEECELITYFYYASGEELEDFNQEYSVVDGQVASFEYFMPMYDSTTYSDYSLFIPYSELHMTSGYHQLKLDVVVWYGDTELTESDWVYFDYTQS